MSKKFVKKDKTTFGQVIQALQDLSKPLPAKYVYKLSDVSAGDLTALKTSWPKISLERRISLLEDALSFSENDESLDFFEVGNLALADPSDQVRELGVRILAPYEMPELAPKFIALSENDPSVIVRAVATAALGVFIFLGEMEEMDQDELENVQAALLRCHAEGQPDLVRRRALEALSYADQEKIEEMIQTAYESSETDWVVSALNAMSRNLAEIWEPKILASLKDLRPAVRAEAAHAAGEMEMELARQQLLEMIRDDNSEAQSTAIWSLSQIGGEGVGAALEKLLEETEDDDLASLIEEALDNLTFTEGAAAFELMDLDPDEDEDDGPFNEDTFLSKYRPKGGKPN